MKGVLMGIVLFFAFGLPASAQGYGESQVVDLQAWSSQQCTSEQCKADVAAIITRIRSISVRVGAYRQSPTHAEYSAIQSDTSDIEKDINAWGRKYHIVPTKVVSERTK